MTLSHVALPVFRRALLNLSGLLDKAAAYAWNRGIDPAMLLEARLAPDMYPFTRQVQLTCGFARNAAARLAGVAPPGFVGGPADIPALKERIAQADAFLSSMDPCLIDGGEEREIVFQVNGEERRFRGRDYLLASAIPNVLFHLTTAYAILRHNGVTLEKRDFTGMP